jgi:hypothetical protein
MREIAVETPSGTILGEAGNSFGDRHSKRPPRSTTVASISLDVAVVISPPLYLNGRKESILHQHATVNSFFLFAGRDCGQKARP